MKNNMKTNMSNKFPSWQFKAITVAVVTGMLGSAAYASLERHGDLEIYKGPQEALPVITLMLDVSGSMEDIDLYGNTKCASKYIQTQSSTTNYPYPRKYCDSGGKRYYRRIDNLKMGVSDLVKDPELQGIVKIGIGTYPREYNNKDNGHIDIPAKKLDATHKADIDTFIATLKPLGWTPASQAYAEAGAYMMGTTTNKLIKNEYTLEKETFRNNQTSDTGYGLEDAKCVGWAPINLNLISASNNLIECNNWRDLGRSLRNSDLNGDVVYKEGREWHKYTGGVTTIFLIIKIV